MAQQFIFKLGFLNTQTNQVEQEVQKSFLISSPETYGEEDWDNKMKECLDDMIANVIPEELGKTPTGQSILNNRHLYQIALYEPQVHTVQ